MQYKTSRAKLLTPGSCKVLEQFDMVIQYLVQFKMLHKVSNVGLFDYKQLIS